MEVNQHCKISNQVYCVGHKKAVRSSSRARRVKMLRTTRVLMKIQNFLNKKNMDPSYKLAKQSQTTT